MRYCLTIFFILFTFILCGQNTLLLEKVGTKRWFSYREGDVVRLIMKEGDYTTGAEIFQITDSSLVTKGNYKIHLNEISGVERIYKNRKANGLLLMVAGGALIAITSINNAVNNQPVLDPVFVSIGAGLAVVGGVWYSQSRKRYKIGNRWKLKVLTPNL